MIHDRVAVGSKIEERKLILSAFCAKAVGLPLVVSNNSQELLNMFGTPTRKNFLYSSSP